MAVSHYTDESPKRTQLPVGYDEDPNEITISFRNVWRALLHKWWVILLCALLGAGTGYGLSKFVLPKTYTVKSIIYLQPDEILVDDNGKIGTFDKKIINNAMYIVENEALLQKLADSANSKVEDIRKQIELLAYGEADMLEVNISGSSSSEAYTLADQFITGAVELLENDIPYAQVSVIQEPVEPRKPSKPSTILVTIIGGLLGLILSFLGLMIYGLRDHRMQTREEAEDYFGKPVYAVLPHTKGGKQA